MLVVALPVRVLAPSLIMASGFFDMTLLALGLLAGGIPLHVTLVRLGVRRLGAARRRRAGPAVALGGLLLVLALAAIAVAVIPGAAHLAHELFGVKSALVGEQAEVTLAVYWHHGGVPGLLALLALPLALVAARRGQDATARLVPVLLASMMAWLWWRTHDYGYAAGPMIAFLAATTIVHLAGRVPRSRRGAALAAMAALTIAPIWPLGITSSPIPSPQIAAGQMLLTPGWIQALRWMRDHTPPLALPLEARLPGAAATFRHPPGNYGVMATWEFGHFIAAIAGRPVLAAGSISAAVARWYLNTDEDVAVDRLRDDLEPGQEIRYIVADARTAGDLFLDGVEMAGGRRAEYLEQRDVTASGVTISLAKLNERYRASMAARLYLDDGDGLAHVRLVYASAEQTALADITWIEDGAFEHLRHATPLGTPAELATWRLIADSDTPVPLNNRRGLVYDATIQPSVKIFEVVAGARLVGQAPPGAALEAHVELFAADSGLKRRYRRAGRADATGRYEIVVAYPTVEEDGSDVTARSAYEIRVEGGDAPGPIGHASVQPTEVRAGAMVTVTPN